MMREIRKCLNQKGFTLIELMVVIAILGVLAAIAIPKFSSATAAANTAKIQADLRTIDSAIITATAAGASITTGTELPQVVKDNLAEVPKAPTGKCFIGGVEKPIPNNINYAIAEINGTMRAVLDGKTSSQYGKDATSTPTPPPAG